LACVHVIFQQTPLLDD
jgi:dynein heavy chain 1